MEPTTKQILICVVISFFLAVSSNRKFFKHIWLSFSAFEFCHARFVFAVPDDVTKILLRNVSYPALGSSFSTNFSMFSGFNVFNVPSS